MCFPFKCFPFKCFSRFCKVSRTGSVPPSGPQIEYVPPNRTQEKIVSESKIVSPSVYQRSDQLVRNIFDDEEDAYLDAPVVGFKSDERKGFSFCLDKLHGSKLSHDRQNPAHGRATETAKRGLGFMKGARMVATGLIR